MLIFNRELVVPGRGPSGAVSSTRAGKRRRRREGVAGAVVWFQWPWFLCFARNASGPLTEKPVAVLGAGRWYLHKFGPLGPINCLGR